MITQHDSRMHGAQLAPHLQAQLDQCGTLTEQCVFLDRLATAVEHEMHATLGFLRRERDERAMMLPQDVHFGGIVTATATPGQMEHTASTSDAARTAASNAATIADGQRTEIKAMEDGKVWFRKEGPSDAETVTSGQHSGSDGVLE